MRILRQLEPASGTLDTYTDSNIFNNSNPICALQDNLALMTPAAHVPVQASQEHPGIVE